jgi:hypothetical protein
MNEDSIMKPDQLRHLMRDPKAMMNFQATGKLPEPPADPKSPLITLLQSFYPTERARITRVIIDHRMGYQGRRTFANAAQALDWLCPPNRPQYLPSESAQDKRFQKDLGVEEFLECAIIPEAIIKAWCRRSGKPRPTVLPAP